MSAQHQTSLEQLSRHFLRVAEEAAKSPMAKKVSDSFKQFQKVVGSWGSVSEKAYYNNIIT